MGGEPKALLEVGGRRIIDRVVAALREVTDDLLVVTNTPELYASLGLPMVPDLWPDGGALGGIHTGLRAAAAPAVFNVACDMPFVSAPLARALAARAGEADVVIPRAPDQYETMHACYAKACLEPMERALRAGRLKVIGFFPEVRVLTVDAEEVRRVAGADPSRVFMNVNTPAELAQARALAGAGTPAPPA
jgi:molybdopterin-guanine dinucleotide biosynthesis protein A